MDISSLRPLEEVEVKITHPVTKEETDIVFTVSGTDSKAYRQAVRDVMVRRMANTEAPTSELEDDEIEILAHCTKGFKGLTIDGKEPEQSLDGFIKIYSEFPWIKEQVDKFIGKKSNFFFEATKDHYTYIRQLAYYYAVPHNSKHSRITELQILNKKMILPVINNGFYLIQYLEEMGFCTNTGEKVMPITFTELNAWVESSGLNLSHNERLHIKRLSDTFVRALNESGMKGAMPYYSDKKADVRSKFKDAFQVLKKK